MEQLVESNSASWPSRLLRGEASKVYIKSQLRKLSHSQYEVIDQRVKVVN